MGSGDFGLEAHLFRPKLIVIGLSELGRAALQGGADDAEISSSVELEPSRSTSIRCMLLTPMPDERSPGYDKLEEGSSYVINTRKHC